jgi:hypothetical protein
VQGLHSSEDEKKDKEEWFETKKNEVKVKRVIHVGGIVEEIELKNHIKENKKYAPTTHRQMDIAAEHALAALLYPRSAPMPVEEKHPAAPADDQVLAKGAA